jgi:hypothetical protein
MEQSPLEKVMSSPEAQVANPVLVTGAGLWKIRECVADALACRLSSMSRRRLAVEATRTLLFEQRGTTSAGGDVRWWNAWNETGTCLEDRAAAASSEKGGRPAGGSGRPVPGLGSEPDDAEAYGGSAAGSEDWVAGSQDSASATSWSGEMTARVELPTREAEQSLAQLDQLTRMLTAFGSRFDLGQEVAGPEAGELDIAGSEAAAPRLVSTAVFCFFLLARRFKARACPSKTDRVMLLRILRT